MFALSRRAVAVIRVNSLLPGLVLGLMLFSSSCGFHLRGSALLPPSLSAVYVEHKQAPWAAEALNRAFTEQQLVPVEEKDQAQVVVRLSKERYQRRVLSVGASGNVQEYELNYGVALEILDSKGQPLAEPQTLAVRRELRYDSTEVVAKAGEEQQLKSEMIADAARQIIRRLQFVDL